jgi:PilZ domain
MSTQNQPATRSVQDSARSEPRFPLVLDITVRTRTRGVLTGRTADISESGISAILRIDVPLSEIVELNFTLPIGQVKVHAIVRQRDCFRFGFQFLESTVVQEVIRSTCRQLAADRVQAVEP